MSDFKITFAGDTSLGDYYLSRPGREKEYERLVNDPMSFFEGVKPLVADSDYLIINFESVLSKGPGTPVSNDKQYMGWDDPDRTIACLKNIGVKAVSLANNHTMDFGPGLLLQTKALFEKEGIAVFGAGETIDEAVEPLRIEVPCESGTRNVYVFGAMRASRRYREDYKVFATEDQPGLARIGSRELQSRIRNARTKEPESHIIVFPHWQGFDYKPPSSRLRIAAQRLVERGADMVIGHGPHMLHPMESYSGKTIAYSIGNFVFNSPGRYQKMAVTPYSALANVTIGSSGILAEESLSLRLLFSDNKVTGFSVGKPDDSSATDKKIISGYAQRDAPSANVIEADSKAFVRKTFSRINPIADLKFNEYSGGSFSTRRLLENELSDLGFQTKRIGKYLFANANGHDVALYETETSQTSSLAKMLVKNKGLARELLDSNGLNIADGCVFSVTQENEAHQYVSDHAPVVIKPVDGNKGRGVSVGVDSQSFTPAWREAIANTSQGVIVERQFEGGVEARYLVIAGKCAAVLRRVPPMVVGNGNDTIAQLVETKNAHRLTNPHLNNRLINLDSHRLHVLKQQGYTLASIPSKGEYVVIDWKAGISTGADSADITDTVHRSFMAVAERATRAFPGLDVAGVDIMATDHAEPASDSNHIVIEVNTRPGIGGHHFPMYGQPRNVAKLIAKTLLPSGEVNNQSNVETGQDDGSWWPGGKQYGHYALVVAARSRGLSAYKDGDFLAISGNGKKFLFRNGYCSASNDDVAEITRKKQATRALLKVTGCEVVRGEVFDKSERAEALAYAEHIGFPVVVKPDSGNKGRGVFVNLNATEGVAAAFDVNAGKYSGIVVEKHFFSDDYRFTTVAGNLVGVLRRVPAYVEGDGLKSIRDLAKDKDLDRKKRLGGRPLVLDTETERFLESKGVSLEYVPNRGEIVQLRLSSNISLVGENVDVTDVVHPGYKELIERAAKGLFRGVFIAGFDVFIKNIEAAPSVGGWAVCEVNDRPGFAGHHWPTAGKERDVAGAVINALFPETVEDEKLERSAADMQEEVNVHLLIKGRVQKVSFRQWLKRNAEKEGVSGWVRNRSDGRVEAVIVGGRAKVEALIELCKTGPRGARVDDFTVKQRSGPVKSGFRLRRTFSSGVDKTEASNLIETSSAAVSRNAAWESLVKRIKSKLSDVRGAVNAYAADLVPTYAPWLMKRSLGSVLIAEAAKRDGASISWTTSHIFKASKEQVDVVFWECRAVETTVSAKLIGRKDYAKRLLKQAGVRVPAGSVARSSSAAMAAWKKMRGPVVLKPRTGQKGQNVMVGMNSEKDVTWAFKKISRAGVLVEELVLGREYRFFVVGREVIAVAGREAPNVIGDGSSTIEQLVEEKNQLRAKNPHLASRPIRFDERAVRFLAAAGHRRDSILAKDEKVYLRREANFSIGGDSFDATDEVSDAAKAMAVRAVRAIPGLEWAGVNIIINDDAPDNPIVLEINSNPGIGGHHFPMVGEPRDVAGAIWRHAFRKQSMWQSMDAESPGTEAR